MQQSLWRASRDYPFIDNADGRPTGGSFPWNTARESLAGGWLANIPASPPAEPDPPNPAEPPKPPIPPRTPEFPPDKEPPGIDDPPPDVLPVPVREPPTMARPLALWLTNAATVRQYFFKREEWRHESTDQ